MKKAILILVVLFASISSSYAGYGSVSESGFTDGQCAEHLETWEVNFNHYYTTYLNGVTFTGSVSNVGDCEAFYYAYVGGDNYSSSTNPVSYTHYYPFFNSSSTFTYSGPADYYTRLWVLLDVYGLDAQIQISWW